MQNLTITLTDRKNTFRTSLGTNNELRVVLHRSSQGFLEQETAEALSQCWELLEFQLGDELSTNTLLKPAPQPSVHSEHNAQDLAKNLYIIGEGRVRLLGFDPQKGREVSVGVLQGGDTFGADAGWGNESLPYQVVAASSGWMACISWEQLQPWLERCPELATHWRQQAQQRQCLSFLKTLTSLRSQSSLILQQLLIYIEETQIPVGESLADLAASQPGYYWLRSGQIHTQEQTDKPNCQPPTIGEGWGYPQEVPTDWVAQTELSVYRLPQASWEAAQEIVPTLAPGDGSDTNGKTAKPTLKASPKKRLTPVSSVPSPTTSTQAEPTPKPQSSDTQPIAFPQPATKRYRGRQFWRGYPFIQQQSSSDCGPTCLAMIGRYWGKRFSINTLRELAGVGRAGASLTGLTKAAQTLSFQATPVRASLSRIAEQQNPWIAHWQGDHYVVVYRVKGDRVLMADPAMGKRLVPRQEFLTNWTGFALLLEPTAQLAAMPDEKLSLKRFWGLLWPHRGILLQVILASLMLQVFGLITPLFTQIILDRVVVNKSLITLQVFAVGLIIFGIWSLGISATRRYLMFYYSNRLSLTFISGFINHTLSLPLKFFESRQVGDIITRVQETGKVKAFLTQQAIGTWLDVLMVFVYAGLMFYYNWQLALLVLATIPPIAILTVLASPFLRQKSREVFKEAAAQNSLLVEMMNGVATVKSTAAEQEVRWRWEERFTSQLNTQFQAFHLSNGLQAVSGLFNTLGSTALLWYGATLVIQDQLTIGQFVAFNMLIGKVTSPILSLVGLWDRFQEILVSVERLNDVFGTHPEEHPQEPMLTMPPIRGDVSLETVTFRYSDEEERNVLETISLDVQAGETIALVGRSGSGKSTLVKLLQGLYHPTSGRITIDGHDIRHVSPQSLRSQLGVVPQDCFLFSGTILENISLYRPDFTLEQVIEVAKLAEAHAFIQALPLGYNTKVGERGSTLSGGQRQRIAIARALLGNPRILILDEATSSLDTESERRFQENLTRISRDRTTFIIAHRLSTVRNADRILVLDRGVLVEQGTHQELLALQGLYYHLAQQQLDL